MTLTPHNDFLTALQDAGREAKINGQGFEPSSRIKTECILQYKSLADDSSGARHPGLFLERKINTPVNELSLLLELVGVLFPSLLIVRLPLAFPTPTQLSLSQVKRGAASQISDAIM